MQKIFSRMISSICSSCKYKKTCPFKCSKCSSYCLPKTYFDIMGTSPKYSINTVHLKEAYLKYQRMFHPDKVNQSSLEVKDISSWLNKAFRTLNDPFERSAYILSLQNVPRKSKTCPEFLKYILLKVE